MRVRIVFILLIFLSHFPVKGQNNVFLTGVVRDKTTDEVMSYVSITVPQMQAGYYSDDSGKFQFQVTPETDSIILSFIGYKDEVIKKRKFKDSLIVVYMEAESELLGEIVIKAPKRDREKDTVAMRIFRAVLANKDDNKPKAFTDISYDEYVKTVASLFNIKESIKDRKIIKPFRFVFENQDTTEDGQRFIPLILKETLTKYYINNDPKKQKSIVHASKVSGIEQLRFSELLDIAFDELDVYGNQMMVYDKAFQLPFADGALLNYKYFIVDSTKMADSINYLFHLAFFPKSKADLAFVGDAWIAQPSYAIQKIKLSIDRRANLNFVNEFKLEQQFEQVPGKGWFKQSEARASNIAFTKRKRSKSIRLSRYLSRRDIVVEAGIPDTIFQGEKMEYEKDYRRRNNEFWNNSRFDSLNFHESNVYWMIDSLKRTRAYKAFSKIGSFFGSGHYRVGKIDIGSLYQVVSWNDVEGVRLRLQVRSNRFLSEKYRFQVHGAYGTLDKKFKYGAEFSAQLPTKPNRSHSVGFNWYDDYQRFSLEGSNLNYDYFYYSLLRKDGIQDLVSMKDLNIFYNRTWFPNFSTTFSTQWRRFQTIPGKVEFIKTLEDGTQKKYETFTVFTPKIAIHATPGSKFFTVGKRQLHLKGGLPRIHLFYTFSKKGWLKSEFNFHKLDLKIEQRVNTPFGYSKIMLTGSKVMGNAPYPLLSIHPGNETFLQEFDRLGMMQEASYLADQKLELFYEHHFNGFFLNKIPGVAKLQLREKFITKMALSSLDPSKVDFIDIPAGLKGLNGYYAEIGFGLENIGKILGVDFMWRMTQKNDPTYDKFKVFFSLSPNF
ncbi:MAG: DUF5686 and carboxypeptidase regulatory-like domain-containing protein [Chitinophagales bacterium]|nr:DUF5686 and carboxypeptidase regulatory-like domain-containing protein [Chitinophagales bacterium]